MEEYSGALVILAELYDEYLDSCHKAGIPTIFKKRFSATIKRLFRSVTLGCKTEFGHKMMSYKGLKRKLTPVLVFGSSGVETAT